VRGRSFFIETIGCQMNEQDSLRISRELLRIGCRRAFGPEDADIVVVNTCAIRQKAEEKVYSLLGRYRSWKQERSGRILAVGGCVAQQDGGRLLRRMSHVDFVFGPHHVSRVGQYMQTHLDARERFSAVSQQDEGCVDDLECPGVSFAGGMRAFITIMEGCNNYCSYCIVPYVRGRERSRPAESIRKEMAFLMKEGVRDITLLGQNVNGYREPGGPEKDFAWLLREIGTAPGLERLRFTTSHPKDLSPAVVACFGEIDALCEHIHLPLQSGSDRILAAMNRKYEVRHYLDRVRDLRSRCPGIAVTTDIIVGFPGESERDFQHTLDVVRDVRFDNIFSFKYSPRQGTRAARRRDSVSETVKSERLEKLQELQKGIGLQKNRELEGACLEVLVEGTSRDGGQLMGRTRTNKTVNFLCERPLGGPYAQVRIEKGCPNSLQGVRIGTPAARKAAGGEGVEAEVA